MPHTCNMQIWVVEYSPTIHIQEMSAIRISLSFENFHIFIVGQCENTFYMSALWSHKQTIQHYKIRKYFAKEQHPMGHCLDRIQKITSRASQEVKL
jgi:hypothetical protein